MLNHVFTDKTEIGLKFTDDQILYKTLSLHGKIESKSFYDFSSELQDLLNTCQQTLGKVKINQGTFHHKSTAVGPTDSDSNPTQVSMPKEGVENADVIDLLMETKNGNGQTLLDQCCFVLYEDMDERYLMHVLGSVPNVVKYLERTNEQGWQPLFRILHLFRYQYYVTDQVTKTKKLAQSILNILIQESFDFLKASKHCEDGIDDVNFFEMLILMQADPDFIG